MNEDRSTAEGDRSPTRRAQQLVDQFGQKLTAVRAQMAARAQATDGQPQRPATERAEEMVDRAGEQIGKWAGRATTEARRLFARAREEVEDMWAEAQSASHRVTIPPHESTTPNEPAGPTH